MVSSRTSYRRQRKFEPGEIITSTDMLLQAAAQGRWIFFGSSARGPWGKARCYHPQWICNMNFNCVCSYIKHGVLRLANRNPEHPYVFKAELYESTVPDVQSEWWAECSEIPGVRIKAFTKAALIRDCERACRDHGLTAFRFQVQFTMGAEDHEVPKLLTA